MFKLLIVLFSIPHLIILALILTKKVKIYPEDLTKGCSVLIKKSNGGSYHAIYCGQKDGYCIVGSYGEDFCIKSFTSVVVDFQDCGCRSFRFVKPKYIQSVFNF